MHKFINAHYFFHTAYSRCALTLSNIYIDFEMKVPEVYSVFIDFCVDVFF